MPSRRTVAFHRYTSFLLLHLTRPLQSTLPGCRNHARLQCGRSSRNASILPLEGRQVLHTPKANLCMRFSGVGRICQRTSALIVVEEHDVVSAIRIHITQTFVSCWTSFRCVLNPSHSLLKARRDLLDMITSAPVSNAHDEQQLPKIVNLPRRLSSRCTLSS